MTTSDSAAETPPTLMSTRAIVVAVVAATIISLSMGLRQSLSLFLPPMEADLGVSASAFGFAIALQSLVWGISQPFIGILGDRFGARPVLVGCAIIYAAGLLLMATASPTAALDLGAGVLVGLGVSGTSFGVLLGTVSRIAPPQWRSQIVGLVSAGGSLGTLALAPFGQILISGHGWRAALIAFAIVALLTGVISFAIGRDRDAPSVSAAQPDFGSLRTTLSSAAHHRGFIVMTVAFFACGFQLLFIATHLPQFLQLCGIAPAVSASALGLIGLGNAIGSYIGGLLGARFSQKRLLALVYLLRTLTIVVYLALPISDVATLVFGFVMGLLWFSVTPLVSGLIGRMFGLQHFNTLFGFTFLSHQLGSFAGAWLGGMSFDFTGSYTVAWSAVVIVGLGAAVLQWLGDDSPAPVTAMPATRVAASA
ncbi:MFS transporter [Bradyrhizobium sp. CB82]|uniref:MFS transporter n=1 Tax=Bradyrhizobium sp. CB82 TaxID=3039159 RepID=UPI0024B1F389|nr:MFS transporter [Bradyrhizobium sp. CB82]WFU44596.1 MFS transporter [Bradyrhizobium sp. CB82]